jgi:hypothetical protein
MPRVQARRGKKERQRVLARHLALWASMPRAPAALAQEERLCERDRP